MALEPIKFDFALSDLPGFEKLPKEKIHQTVSGFFGNYFKSIGGDTTVEIDNDRVIVQWFPKSASDTESAIHHAVELLNRGQISQGETMLSALFRKFPEHPVILYNYGMILSDRGKPDKAAAMLARLTELHPDDNRAWNALAVACSRAGKKPEALKAVQKSYALDPDDPYTLKNFGGILAADDPEKGLPYLEKAARLLPEDAQAQYGYGICLMKLNRYNDADFIMQTVIGLAPYSEFAELAKEARTEISRSTMQKNAEGRLRMDVVMYCLAALEKFQAAGPQQSRAITYEIAMLGRGGLDINNPDRRYTLKSIQGEFTGLQLLSYMFVGLKQINPPLDPGIDFEKEYQAALDLFDQKAR
jgi:tetratricopeptide (TPR) repeat protein